MGYMGLANVLDSDNAASVAYDAIWVMVKSLKKALKEKANKYNTNGPENVALFFESYIVPASKFYNNCGVDELFELADKTAKKLEKLIKKTESQKWADAKSKKEHLAAYRRMLKNVQKIKPNE